jgi:hypothetical protein
MAEAAESEELAEESVESIPSDRWTNHRGLESEALGVSCC